MALKALLFDCDGTLVDSESVHRVVWNEVLAPFDVVISEEEYRRHYSGNPVNTSVEYLLECHPHIDERAEALIRRKTAETTARFAREPVPLMAGVHQAFAWAGEQQLRCALVTGSGHDEIAPILSQHDLHRHFECLVARQDVEHSKPHPASYLRALALLDIAPEQAIALEDTSHGVRSAVAAGVEVIAIPNAYSREHDFDGAVAVVDDLEAAIAWIQANRVS
ncbi:HAD family hydrolase [Larsenimonas rhizosphaerae]|uniref:HAD family phosphatase n=1 Tax=Larsenimonas rhizosphaerae TaxID=2944682 RepID=A0AA42CUL4_9GAMM|nr:HAD family phosphatase [Larsenimonas rhizosphaerae]MCM2129834.1 HAD family phosphatase [Larsenimonas rhizosphaerae]MCX2524494.1 HAD family phosphatase [Larsenimonas rhizosphaerae]